MRPKEIHDRSFKWTLESTEEALLDYQGRCEQINRYNRQAILMFLVAFALRVGLPAIDGFPHTVSIIHELCHAVAVIISGGEVVSMTATYIVYRGGSRPFAAAGGYYGELLLYSYLAIKSPWSRLGKFSAMLLFLSGLAALEVNPEHDFTKAAHAWPNVRIVFILLWLWVMAFAIYRLGKAGELHYPEVPEDVKADYFEKTEKKDRPDSLKTPTDYKRPPVITW